MNFEAFIKQDRVNNSWIKEGEGKMRLNIYVRRTHESLKDIYGDFQLANMSAASPGNGALRRFLDKWEPMYDLYVENVLNVALRRFLERRGYVGDSEPHAPSYLRRKTKGGVNSAKGSILSASRAPRGRNQNRDAKLHKGGDRKLVQEPGTTKGGK